MVTTQSLLEALHELQARAMDIMYLISDDTSRCRVWKEELDALQEAIDDANTQIRNSGWEG